MEASPAGKKPAPPKKTSKSTAAAKKRAGVGAPGQKAKQVSAKKPLAKQAAAKAKAKVPAKADAVKKVSVSANADKPLTPKMQDFVNEYLVDLNGTQAAIRAGYSARSAAEQAYDLLRKPQILDAITLARKAQQERTQIDADRVVREAWNIATADARELVEVKVGCCRHCWGEDHKYQRTIGEFNAARARHMDDKDARGDFDEEGGIGYDPLKPPHPMCTSCCGDGQSRVVLCDTRKLSAQAQALFAGAKVTKHGIEIQMHSKLDALEKLAKHLGLYEKDNQQKTDPLASLLHAISSGNSNGFMPVKHDPERGHASGGTTPLKATLDPADDEG